MTDEARARWEAISSSVRKESFAGAALSSVSLGRPGNYVFFDRVDFRGTDFRLATLCAHFKMCSFVGANLRGADLRGSSFGGCNLTDANLRDADLRAVRFGRVNTGADNGRTIILGARFAGALLTGTMFEDIVGVAPVDADEE